MERLWDWVRGQLNDPQVVGLITVLLASGLMIVFAGNILAPVFAAVVFAYLLEGPVAQIERRGLPRSLASTVVWFLFVAGSALVIFALVPLLSRQATQIVQEIPKIVNSIRDLLIALPEEYPTIFSEAQIESVIAAARNEIGQFSQAILSRSLIFTAGIMLVAVYMILVPLLIFFMLKDKEKIVEWLSRFLPTADGLLNYVWADVDRQLSNYVRGKFVEIVIVWGVSFVTFTLLDLNYAMLLAAIVGVSVLVPYLGAFVATFPVAFVAYAQWGFGSELGWVLFAYGIVQALDGNVLVPLLFSEAVDLHPVAIIVAVLFFGGVWGFWGVFFAIPLATLVHAVINAWPKPESAVAESS